MHFLRIDSDADGRYAPVFVYRTNRYRDSLFRTTKGRQMKIRAVLSTLALASLAGCGTWHRPGSTEAEFNQERYACQQEAASTYPIVMASSGGGYQGASQTSCTGYGNMVNCTTTPGAYVPPPQSDQNAIPRAMAFDSCMKAKGWTFQL